MCFRSGVVSYKTDALRQTDRVRPSLYQSKSYQLLQKCRNKLYNKSTVNKNVLLVQNIRIHTNIAKQLQHNNVEQSNTASNNILE